MKFVVPSIDYLLDQTKAAARRFPAAVFFAAAACAFSIHAVHAKTGGVPLRAVLACALGIPLGIAGQLYMESKGRHRPALLAAVLAAVTGGVFLWLRALPDVPMGYLYAHLSLGAHLLAAFSLSVDDPDMERFWQFNRVLFLRFIATFIFANALYGGLAASLATVDLLFKVTIPGETYADLWMVAVYVFNTLFFTAGIPRGEQLDGMKGEYPRLLKVFCQYVAVPILAIYGAILYAYLARTVVHMEIPRGQTSFLVSGFAVTGMLTLLLLHPVAANPENRWVRFFSRGFYAGIIPLLGLMMAALYLRISEYGITEQRYALGALGLWLFAMAVYFLSGKDRPVKMVPISLAAVVLFTAVGPWGTRGLSRWSQKARLMDVLEANGLLSPMGVFQKAPQKPSRDVQANVSGLVDYLLRNHGLSALKKHLPPGAIDEKTLARGRRGAYNHITHREDVMRVLGFAFVYREPARNQEHFNFYSLNDGKPQVSDISAYDQAWFNLSLSGRHGPARHELPNGWTAGLEGPGKSVFFIRQGERLLFQKDLVRFAADNRGAGIPTAPDRPRALTLEAESDALKIRLMMTALSCNLSEDRPELHHLSGHLFWSEKNKPSRSLLRDAVSP